MRCIRTVNPNQEDYSGIIMTHDSENEYKTYEYGVTSLADKHDFLQRNDIVHFQIAKVISTDELRATNVQAIRDYKMAAIYSIKDYYGFLNYETIPGKKLFFHKSDVHESLDVKEGDIMQFVLIKNQQTDKYAAASLRLVQKCEDLEKKKNSMILESVIKTLVQNKSIINLKKKDLKQVSDTITKTLQQYTCVEKDENTE
ncbi:hypothetical protein A3Q56_04767 [Intoshia linei]|uniref:CSD domain-containing protein n=1 Tax=Intoshia linei TaxID=1819745 RepID=A0A177AZN8_9BILA|nr:hypothetical protein A3Q56_04767 [Intoshia linei]